MADDLYAARKTCGGAPRIGDTSRGAAWMYLHGIESDKHLSDAESAVRSYGDWMLSSVTRSTTATLEQRGEPLPFPPHPSGRPATPEM